MLTTDVKATFILETNSSTKFEQSELPLNIHRRYYRVEFRVDDTDDMHVELNCILDEFLT